MSTPASVRLCAQDLARRIIVRAEVDEDGALLLTLGPRMAGGAHANGAHGSEPLVLAVMRDPEGNGPGAAHVLTPAGSFVGILGGDR